MMKVGVGTGEGTPDMNQNSMRTKAPQELEDKHYRLLNGDIKTVGFLKVVQRSVCCSIARFGCFWGLMPSQCLISTAR
jgi:hypothetical protein